MWRYHFYSFLSKYFIHRIAIISHIANQSFWFCWCKAFRYSFFNEFNLMGACFMCGNGDRKTIAVCNRHDLGTLATLSFANSAAPFLADAKLPSIKHSARSIFPLIFKSKASLTRIFSQTLFLTHSRKRRWQVWYGGYLSGRSFHGAPVLQIHRMPFKILRSSTRGRPDIFFFGSEDSIMGLTMTHCSFVISMNGKFQMPPLQSKNFFHTNSHF
jgi:hypothetical protein